MLEMFTWGYWGWGGATRQLVRAFGEAEAMRGYGPPVFVDLRLHRNVRSDGFRGDAFEKIVGQERHVWMPELGNEAVLGKSHVMCMNCLQRLPRRSCGGVE